MDLSVEQERNLVQAMKKLDASRRVVENSQKVHAANLEKLKTCCQGSGSEQQVVAHAYEILGKMYLNKPEDPGMEA